MIDDRRQGLRRQVKSLVYANIDSHNGGILVNLSKAGLAMRVIDPVSCNQPVRVAFCLPGRGDCVEVAGQVAWTDEVGLTAGVRALDVTSPSQELIESWLSNGSGHGGEESSTSVVDVGATEPLDRTPDPEISNMSEPMSPTEGDRREPALTELRQAFAPTASGNVSGRQRTSWQWASRRKRIAGLIGAGIIVAVLAGAVLPGVLTTPHYQPSGWVVDFWTSVSQVIALGRGTATSPALDQNHESDRKTEQARGSTGQPRTLAALVRSDGGDEKKTPIEAVTRPDSMSLQVPRADHFRVEGSSEHRLVAAFARRNATPLPRLGEAQGVERSGVAQQTAVVPLVNYSVSQEASGAISERRILPLYPQAARQRSVEGTVVVNASIDTDGTVKQVRLISGDPLLAGAVLDAVRLWRYGPHIENGRPMERETQIRVTFQIFTE